MSFRRANIFELSLRSEVAHGGSGTVDVARVLSLADVSGPCNFVDYVELPTGSSIGEHRHSADTEEYYLVLQGAGRMTVENDAFDVAPGEFVRNPPGALHGLVNVGDAVLRLFVFEIAVQ